MKKIITDNIFIFLFGSVFIFWGCSDNNITSFNETSMHEGHFVSVFDHNIEYHCLGKVIPLSDDGEFKCQSFPISFYMDNVKLGEISSIHKDGYVFPQDIVVLEEQQPVYSSYDSMKLVGAYE